MKTTRFFRLAAGMLLLALPLLAPAFTATQHGNQLLIDGAPTSLTFAWGCTDPATLPSYRQLGFNTVIIHVDSLGTDALDNDVALAKAAAEANMYVLVELANGSWSADERVNLSDKQYLASVKYYLDTVLPRLQQNTHLLGWVISTVQEGRLVSDIGTFSEYLQEKYHTLDKLNDVWSASASGSDAEDDSGDAGNNRTAQRSDIPSFNILDEKTALKLCNQNPSVLKIVHSDIDEYRQLVAARDTDFQQYLHTRYATLNALNERWRFSFARWDSIRAETIIRREAEKPGSSPFSLLELARYQALTPSLLMSWWVQQVTGRDKTHLIFAGAQRSYRSLVGLPPTINGVVTECFPGVAEADRESHNPQAIDLARHGNRFIVLAGILARNVDALRYGNYLYIGPLHGAAGIGVSDFPTLLASPALAEATQLALKDIAQRQLLSRIPAPCTAIVYNPYSLGVHGVNSSPYGFMPGLGFYSPGILMFFLRNGTSYGQVDYLAADDLTHLPLNTYRTIILPEVFDLPYPAQLALLAFVDGGGTVLADLGVGTLEADAQLYDMPLPLQALFGVMSPTGVTDTRLNLEVFRPNPYFPSLVPGPQHYGDQRRVCDHEYGTSHPDARDEFTLPGHREYRAQPPDASVVSAVAACLDARDVYRATWQRICHLCAVPAVSMLAAGEHAVRGISSRFASAKARRFPSSAPSISSRHSAKSPPTPMRVSCCGRKIRRSR